MRYIIILICFLSALITKAQNLQLRSSLSYGSTALANIGGYVDSLDNEYALVGTEEGLDIVDVSDPSTPVIKFSVPGATSAWREVKTYRKYAYVTTEGGGGLTIVDLKNLPASVNFQQYTGDGAIAGQLNSIHALHCDTASGFLYLYGSNIGGGHTLFLDLSDPWNPVFAGEYIYPGGGNISYVHDGFVCNDTMYEAHIYAGFFTVVDVTNKSNPVLLATQTTPTAFTHNTWLSDDHRTLFTTDENNGSYLGAYDISDLQNIREISRYQTAPGSNAVIHNTHILNDYAVTSWYKEGVVIVDVSRPDNPVEVAKYDTYPQGSGGGTTGCWGVYPFLPSGTVVASDIVNGLFVFTPTYVRGCYLEGIVTDSISGISLPGATVSILSTSSSRITNATGEYKTGILDSGTYDVQVSRPGYITKIISSVSLANGVLTSLDVQLAPLPTFSVSGLVTDSLTGIPLRSAQVLVQNADFNYLTTTDSLGQFSLNAVSIGTYDIICGIWGHVTKCMSQLIDATTPVQFELMQGYYDDFTFDFGWMVSGTSLNAWERGIPNASYDNFNNIINPGNDVISDCSNQCYVTDNGIGPYNNHDVDNGNTMLTSPVFDASIYNNPTVEYSRWFVNTGGSGTPNDSMNIYLSNGTDMVRIESVHLGSAGLSAWFDRNYLISTFLTPTSTMQLIVDIADVNPGHILEGGLDHFRISGQLNVGLNSMNIPQLGAFEVFPNPFVNTATLKYHSDEDHPFTRGEIFDSMGRLVEDFSLEKKSGEVSIGRNLNDGIYFIRFVTADGYSGTVKLIK